MVLTQLAFYGHVGSGVMDCSWGPASVWTMGEGQLNFHFKIRLIFQLGPWGSSNLIGCKMNSKNNVQ